MIERIHKYTGNSLIKLGYDPGDCDTGLDTVTCAVGEER